MWEWYDDCTESVERIAKVDNLKHGDKCNDLSSRLVNAGKAVEGLSDADMGYIHAFCSALLDWSDNNVDTSRPLHGIIEGREEPVTPSMVQLIAVYGRLTKTYDRDVVLDAHAMCIAYYGIRIDPSVVVKLSNDLEMLISDKRTVN